MKKQILTRLISAFLAFVMVFLMMPISIFSVSAAGDDEIESLDPIEEYRANTTKSLEQITKYINDREAEDKALENSFGYNIKKINTFSRGIGTAINTALMIYNTIDEDASWDENLGNIALNLVSSYLGVQLPGQASETEVIIKEVEKMLSEVNSRIDQVNEKIDALSDQVDQNTSNLAHFMLSVAQFGNDMAILNEFTQASDSSAYSYYTHREKLYACYNELMYVLDSSTATSSEIKSAYDKLYIEAIKSEQLYKYMTGENRLLTDDKSIQEALYEYSVLGIYLNSRGELKDKQGNLLVDKNGNLQNIEIKCIEFAQDLYSTYMFSNYALMLCYNYQIDYLNSHSNDALISYYDVEGLEGTNNILGVSIFGSEKHGVDGKIPSMLEEQETINQEIASYIAYVLNLDGSYLYENGERYEDGTKVGANTIYSVPYKEVFEEKLHKTIDYSITYGNLSPITKYVRTNNKVSKGDTLYMNVLPNDLASLFASGKFTFTTSDDTLARVNNAGVVNVVGTSGTFVISMKYNEKIIYSLEFVIEGRLYSGGMGIESCPYLVSKWKDITDLAGCEDHYQAKNIYFKMTNDITGEGATFSGIPSFKGTWDGNGYRVYYFKIDTNGINYTGFFRTIEKEATVKNFILGDSKKEYSEYLNYSVLINGYMDSYGTFCVGGLSGINRGTIENCSLESVRVLGKIYWAGDNDISNIVGGIAGINEGEIDNCIVAKSCIYSNATAKKDGDASFCEAYTGGIIGKNVKLLKNSVSYSNHVEGYTYSKQDGGDAPGAYTYCGAMVGWLTSSATVENCYEQKNNLVPVADADDSSNDAAVSDGICGFRDAKITISGFAIVVEELGTITDCGRNSLGSWVISPITNCPIRETNNQDSEEGTTEDTFSYALEYVRGEIYLKSSSDGNLKYSIQEHRLDTSDIGDTFAIKLTAVPDTNMYVRTDIAVTVVAEEPQELCVYTPPHKLVYNKFDTELDLQGLKLVLLYNNGTVKFLNDGSEPGSVKEFTETFDFSNVGETEIVFEYENFDEKVTVTVSEVECTDHNFQNGICTACQQLNATLKARSITLGGMIGMNFYFEIDPAIVSNNAAYVNFTVAGGRNIQIPVSRGVVDTTSMPGTTLYCFSCPLYATEMSAVVVAKIVMGENESKAYERTVISYANIILNGAYDDEDKAVVKAMLNYGASSQLEFDHNTENLANSGLDAQDKEIPNVTASDFATTITSANLDGIGKYYAASLSLGSETTITAYFELADGVGVNDITFTLGSRVLTSTPEIIGGKTYAAVIINGISADKLDDVFTVTATMGNSSGTFQCSAFRYCYSVMKAQDGVYTETLKNVLKTMYAYNQATIAYLNKNA